jgi:hypothetical protein
MKRTFTFVLVALLVVIATIFSATNVNATTEHCPDGWTEKFEAAGSELNGVVLPAGIQFCVKGSTDATGILTADGKTLYEYLGNGHDVSYYVIYGTEPPPPPPPPPTDTPTPVRTDTPVTPTVTPQPAPTACDEEDCCDRIVAELQAQTCQMYYQNVILAYANGLELPTSLKPVFCQTYNP